MFALACQSEIERNRAFLAILGFLSFFGVVWDEDGMDYGFLRGGSVWLGRAGDTDYHLGRIVAISRQHRGLKQFAIACYC
jgi:hypothetical protein